MKKIQIFLAICAVAFSAVSCRNASEKLLPNVSGKAGEVLVVAEKAWWSGHVGTILRDSLTADCPYLPQKEPLYSLITVTPSNFNQMFQIHRNIIMLNINAGVSVPGVVYKKDKWSHPQIVITVNAADQDSATALLEENMHQIIATLEQTERDRVVANTRRYQEAKLVPVVREFTGGGEMVFPSGYQLKKRTEDFLWISYETTYVQQGIFISKYPSTHKKSELSSKALVDQRNTLLKNNVPGMFEGTYMTTSRIITPSVKYAAYKGIKFAELRGFWDVEGDFMGGPFVSHTFYNRDGSELICIEAYVYAPKYDKRLYLRQIESLLYGFEWADSADKK